MMKNNNYRLFCINNIPLKTKLFLITPPYAIEHSFIRQRHTLRVLNKGIEVSADLGIEVI
jgi:hypothetical protein